MKKNIYAQKTAFYHFGAQQDVLNSIKTTFFYNLNELSAGFNYLGYFLKVGRYKVEEWDWLIAKYERRISHWCNKWLTLGGRLVLIKAVLESQPVYWLALANIPSLVLIKIRQLVFNFLWNGKRKNKGFHLCSWHIIAHPRKYGGWGLRNLDSFSKAMAVNTLWRALMHDGLWHRVLKSKYFSSVSVACWLRMALLEGSKGSPTWRYLQKSLYILLHWLAWRPSSGELIMIGKDQILGMGDKAMLSDELITI
jgi:hypothetical protein